MPKKSQWIWYRTNSDVFDAFLFNCRKRDLWDGIEIIKGSIIEGINGYVAAESRVPKVTGKVVAFQANRRCEWQGLELNCIAKVGAPSGQPVPRTFNYIVAHISSLESQRLADRMGVRTVRTPNGEIVVNLELARFRNQDTNRRAILL